MTSSPVLVGGLLHADEFVRDYEFFEMPPRIPEEDLLASQGACAGSQYEGFMLQGPQNAKVQQQAKAMCNACPVREECRIVADYLRENMADPRWMVGMWAGETSAEQQRRHQASAA